MKPNRNMIRLVLCALLLTACHNEPKSDPNVSLVDYCVSAFPVGMSLYTAGNRQYVAYYDSLHQMTVAMRNLPDGPWAYQKLDEKVPWDAHNSVTMCMDKHGVMHVVGNMRASPLNYFVQTLPETSPHCIVWTVWWVRRRSAPLIRTLCACRMDESSSTIETEAVATVVKFITF